MVGPILQQYGLNVENCRVQALDSGLINKTWKVSTPDRSYILQKINDYVFKKPGDIDHNLLKLKSFLSARYPDYLFVAPFPLPTAAL